MLRVLHLLCVLGPLMLLKPAQSGFYDYDNEVYDYYRQESSNQDSVQSSVAYDCKSEGFHEDPNDCRTFYRCVNWGNGSPLTPFKFECGTGTVFSSSKGNVCVHPTESGRPECCEPSNEIESDEPTDSDAWSQEPGPGYPSHNPGTQQPSYPSQTQGPQQPSYPSHTQGPQQPSYPSHTQGPQQPSYPSQTQGPQYPNQLPQTQKPVYPGQPPQTQRPQQPNYPSSTQAPQQPSYPSKPLPPDSTHCSGDQSSPCGSSPGCTQEGFFPNPEDCHKFYRCVNEGPLKRYDFTCGTGTAWDQAAQTCNHEYSVPNCGSGSGSNSYPGQPGSGSQISNSSSTTPFTYPPTQTTYYPTKPTYLPPKPTPYPTPYPTKPTYLPPPQSSQNPSSPGYPGSQPSPYPPNNNPGSTTVTKPTPYPSQVPTQSSSQSTSGPTYVPPQSSTNNPPSGNNNNPSEAPGTGGKPCPPTGSSKDCKEEGFFSNPQDCHKFYRCVNEDGSFHKYDFECGTGTAWDQQQQTCNYENAIPGCGNSQPPPDYDSSPVDQKPGTGVGPNNGNQGSSSETSQQPQVTTSVTQSTTTLPSTQSTPQQTSAQPQTPQQTTPSEGSQSTTNSGVSHPQKPSNGNCQNEGFFANSDDCRKFYRCVSNPPGYIKYDFDCGPGTAWDQSLLTCNYIAQVASCNSGHNEIDSNESTPNGSSSTSPSTNSPSSTEPSVESTPDQSKPTQSTTATYEPSSENPNSTEGSSTISTSSENSTSTSSPQSSSESSVTPDCSTPKPNDTIVCNKPGFYPHPTRCDKFYRCVDNGKGFNVYHFDCPAGTIFDPTIDVCNYPESVYPSRNCETGPQVSTSPQSQVSTTPGSTSGSTSPDRVSSTTPSSTTGISSESTSGSTAPGSSTEPSTSSTTESSSESTTSTDESSTSSSESTTPDSESTTSGSESTTPNSESTTSSSESTTPDSESTTSSSESTTPSSESTTPDSESTTSSSESTTPGSESTTPGSESTTPSSESTTPSSESTTPSSESTTPEPESTTSSSESTTPSSESTTPDSESTTSSSESTTPGSESTTPDSESTTSSSETTTSSSESTTEDGDSSTSSSETTTAGSSEATTDSTSPSEQQSTTSSSEEMPTSMISTTDSEESTSSTDKPSTVENCPTLANLTDEQIVLVCPTGFRRHPKLCNLFYQCTMSGNMEVKILMLQCPEGTIFDEKSNKCLSESESSEPCKGTTAGKRIQRRVNNALAPPIEVSTKPLCPDEGHFPHRKGCSNIFYKCKRDSRQELQGFLYKCPKNFVYWSVSRRCERASRLPMCTSMSDETENQNEAWENRWEIPVEDRNLSARRSLF